MPPGPALRVSAASVAEPRAGALPTRSVVPVPIRTVTHRSASVVQPLSWGQWGVLGALGGAVAGGAAALAGVVTAPVLAAAAVTAGAGLLATEAYAWMTERGGNPNEPGVPTEMQYPSRYDPTKNFSASRMAVSRAVYNKGKGHTLVAFEWVDETAKPVHQLYHFTGQEAHFLYQATVGGAGKMKFVGEHPTKPGVPKAVEQWDDRLNGTSTPEFFNSLPWESYGRTWVVRTADGKRAVQKARVVMGRQYPFLVTPWWPTSYNCVQMAAEVLNEAGIYPASPFEHALSIYAPRMISGLRRISAGTPRPTAPPLALAHKTQ